MRKTYFLFYKYHLYVYYVDVIKIVVQSSQTLRRLFQFENADVSKM